MIGSKICGAERQLVGETHEIGRTVRSEQRAEDRDARDDDHQAEPDACPPQSKRAENYSGRALQLDERWLLRNEWVEDRHRDYNRVRSRGVTRIVAMSASRLSTT